MHYRETYRAMKNLEGQKSFDEETESLAGEQESPGEEHAGILPEVGGSVEEDGAETTAPEYSSGSAAVAQFVFWVMRFFRHSPPE